MTKSSKKTIQEGNFSKSIHPKQEVEMTSPHSIPLSCIDRGTQHAHILTNAQVLEQIRTTIRSHGCLPERRAIVVRPTENGRYNIVDGHTRFTAATLEHLETIPCYINQYDDVIDMHAAIVTENSHEGMSNLEIGIIATYIPPSKGGRGVIGGIAKFAEIIGYDIDQVRSYRDAALVYIAVAGELTEADKIILKNKVNDLKLIKPLPENLWSKLVQVVLTRTEGQKNLKDVLKFLKQVNAIDDCDRWANLFFPKEKMIDMYLDNATGINAIKRTFNTLSRTVNELNNSGRSNSVEKLNSWLAKNAFQTDEQNRERYKFRSIIKHCATMLNLKIDPIQNFIHDDCLTYIPSIRDESIKLTLIDPPYGVSFNRIGCHDQRILNDTRPESLQLLNKFAELVYPKMADNSYVIVFCPDLYVGDFIHAFTRQNFVYSRQCVWKKNNHSQGDLYGGALQICEFFLCFRKSSPTLLEATTNHFDYPIPVNRIHPCQKPLPLLAEIIESFSAPGDLIFDGFAGSASTLLAAKRLGRRYLGCELDDNFYATAFARLEDDDPNDIY